MIRPTLAIELISRKVVGQFSLASVFLVITLIAVCLGTLRLAPGVGILLLLVATPALIGRASWIQGEARGHSLSIGENWSPSSLRPPSSFWSVWPGSSPSRLPAGFLRGGGRHPAAGRRKCYVCRHRHGFVAGIATIVWLFWKTGRGEGHRG